MGVRYLCTYISRSVKNGLFPVNMASATQACKRNKGETPTIIVDLMMLLSFVHLNSHEILLGGRFDVYNERARKMFSKLKSLGANLIFFFDGPTQNDKMETCLERCNKACEETVKLLHAIDDGLDLSGDLSDYKIICTAFFSSLQEIAREFGEVYLSTLNESDQDMVELANRKAALAILTDDTDFLIFEGDWRVWSVKYLNFNTMYTMEYNRRALRVNLSLSARQMALFASLSGNDIVKYEMVQKFHRRISSQPWTTFKAIAGVVRKMNSLPPQLSFFDKNTLANAVFDPADREEGMRALQNSMNFYCLVDLQFKQPNELTERLMRDLRSFQYAVFTNRSHFLVIVYYDLLKKIFTPYHEIMTPLVRRVLGVLLQHENIGDVRRTFYFKCHHDRPVEPIHLSPEYPPNRAPPPMELLYRPSGDSPDLDDLRWNLLCFIVSQKLTQTRLQNIPKENFTNVLTLFHLVENNQISTDEADCVLISCNCTPAMLQDVSYDEVRQINGRDARLSFLYAKFFDFINTCISTVGLREYNALLKFDGLYFHNLRIKWMTANAQFKNMLIEPFRAFRIYAKDD